MTYLLNLTLSFILIYIYIYITFILKYKKKKICVMNYYKQILSKGNQLIFFLTFLSRA